MERGTLDIDGIVKASHAKHEQNLKKTSSKGPEKSRDRQKTSKKMDESIFTNIDERQLLRATRLDKARPLLNALKKATTILPAETIPTQEKKISKERKRIAPSEGNEESKNFPKDLKKREEIKERHRQKDAEMKTKMQVLQEKIKYNPQP